MPKTKQNRLGFSVPEGVDRKAVLRGLTQLAGLLDCTGRGAAASASALVVQLGLIAHRPGGADQLAQALEEIFSQARTSETP